MKIGRKNNRFTIDGEPRVLRMRSSFALMAHLDRWAQGMGGVHEDRVDRWFERVATQGFDGVRVFGETHYWTGGLFYPNYATTGPIWDWNQLQYGGRPTKVTIHNDKIIRKLVEKLKKHGLICNYVVDATMKHSGIDAGMIGHVLRQTANYMRQLEGELGSLNLWIEGHNEWSAHNQAGLDVWELNQQAARFRRSEQWPGSIITVSESGGTNDYRYRVGGTYYDAVDIHPDRGSGWDELPSNWKRLTSQGVPCYFSETNHYMSQPQWDEWVPKISKWARQSTTDHDAVLSFMDKSINNGISFCIHDLTGQMTDPDQPLSPLEIELGGTNPEPPGPEPPPLPNVWVTVYEDEDTRLQRLDTYTEPTPEPEPEPPSDSTDYVNMARVPEVRERIEAELDIWAGVRDLNYVLGRCKWAFPNPFDEAEFRVVAREYSAIIEEGGQLRTKLQVIHPDYPGRSRVRKSVVKDFFLRLDTLNDLVESYRKEVESWPGAGTSYDSIAGWCQYCNDNDVRNP